MESLNHKKLGRVFFWISFLVVAAFIGLLWLFIGWPWFWKEKEIRNDWQNIPPQVTPEIPKDKLKIIPEKGKGMLYFNNKI